MSLYLHVPTKTAANFEEALRRLAVSQYIQQRLNRVDPIREPAFFERFGGMFAEALKTAGATFDSEEPGRWNLGEVESPIVVVIPVDDARALVCALQELSEPYRPSYAAELFYASADVSQALRWVLDMLLRLLDLEVNQRPRETLRSAA